MEETFIVKKGIHNVPNHGRVDCNKKINQSVLVALYLNKHFSQFITLKKGGIKLLRKEKLTDAQIVQLIQRAKTTIEVDWLLEVKSNKVINKIAETRKNSLQGDIT